MADPSHLDVLGQGVDAWNEWRANNPRITPDLTHAPLADLKLRGANLSRADLSHADLGGTRLTNADLSGADLRHVNLLGAMLSGANLQNADLDGANLIEANFNQASLRFAHLGYTLLYETNFGNVDLTGARGLESCVHVRSSTLDHRTIARSGPLPIEFLRGCGLPDFIIDNVGLLHADPIQFYSCFISYSNEDRVFAEVLHADLQENGVRCWFAPHDMRGGQEIHSQIRSAIRLHDKVLLVLSEASIHSEWVRTEVRNACQRERDEGRTLLFPIALLDPGQLTKAGWEWFDADTGLDLAERIRRFHILDFREWTDSEAYRKSFHRLLRDLERAESENAVV